jgi:hypothetical protein
MRRRALAITRTTLTPARSNAGAVTCAHWSPFSRVKINKILLIQSDNFSTKTRSYRPSDAQHPVNNTAVTRSAMLWNLIAKWRSWSIWQILIRVEVTDWREKQSNEKSAYNAYVLATRWEVEDTVLVWVDTVLMSWSLRVSLVLFH